MEKHFKFSDEKGLKIMASELILTKENVQYSQYEKVYNELDVILDSTNRDISIVGSDSSGNSIMKLNSGLYANLEDDAHYVKEFYQNSPINKLSNIPSNIKKINILVIKDKAEIPEIHKVFMTGIATVLTFTTDKDTVIPVVFQSSSSNAKMMTYKKDIAFYNKIMETIETVVIGDYKDKYTAFFKEVLPNNLSQVTNNVMRSSHIGLIPSDFAQVAETMSMILKISDRIVVGYSKCKDKLKWGGMNFEDDVDNIYLIKCLSDSIILNDATKMFLKNLYHSVSNVNSLDVVHDIKRGIKSLYDDNYDNKNSIDHSALINDLIKISNDVKTSECLMDIKHLSVKVRNKIRLTSQCYLMDLKRSSILDKYGIYEDSWQYIILNIVLNSRYIQTSSDAKALNEMILSIIESDECYATGMDFKDRIGVINRALELMVK